MDLTGIFISKSSSIEGFSVSPWEFWAFQIRSHNLQSVVQIFLNSYRIHTASSLRLRHHSLVCVIKLHSFCRFNNSNNNNRRQQVQTLPNIWWDIRPYNISMANTGKRTVHKRHDTVCAKLHFNMRKATAVQLDKKHWYEHVPKSAETSQGGR